MGKDVNGGEYFERVAPQWDQMRQRFFSENVRAVVYDTANVQPGKLAADIGAGTGFITEGLLRKGLRVIAVDLSEAMLEELRKKFGDFNAVDCRAGESAHLPIADAAVDYVFANMYLHHVEKPSDALREMARVLRTGGKVVITDLDEHCHEFLRAEHHDRWMGFKREDVRLWFEKAGLRNARVDCVGENCCATSGFGAGSAAVGIFIASGEK
jgi:ubiquinone/menaquinone biosynthesis C-methylase UbiE